MTIRITDHGANTYSIRGKSSPKSVRFYKPTSIPLHRLADLIGEVIVEWDDLGKALAFFTASPSERHEAARTLGITFKEE